MYMKLNVKISQHIVTLKKNIMIMFMTLVLLVDLNYICDDLKIKEVCGFIMAASLTDLMNSFEKVLSKQ